MRGLWRWMTVIASAAGATAVEPRAVAEHSAALRQSRFAVSAPPAPTSLRVASAPALPQIPQAAPSLSELVNQRQFDALLQRIPQSGTPPAERLLRAHSALLLGKGAEALSALDGLEIALPAQKGTIIEYRERARALSDDVHAALPELARSSQFEMLLGLSKRLLAEGDLGNSERFVGHSLRAARGKITRERPARLQRAQIYLAQDRPFAALSDLHWLALEQAGSEEGELAVALISLRFPRHPLSPEERRKRAELLAERGAVDLLRLELEQLTGLTPKLRETQRLHLEGTALFRHGDYARAAEYLVEAARDPQFALVDRLAAGRAHSRLGQNAEAIALFREVSAQQPATRLTLLANYYAAEELAFGGLWSEALTAYEHFLQHFGGSEFRVHAERGRAVSLFALGNMPRAQRALTDLRNTASPNDELRDVYQLLIAICQAQGGDIATARITLSELAGRLPVSFAGIFAQKRLQALGFPSATLGPLPSMQVERDFALPESVTAFEELGLSEWAERELQFRERELRVMWAPTDAGTFCNAYGKLTRGQRRFDWANQGVTQLGFFRNPHLTPAWLWRCFFPTPHREAVSAAAADNDIPATLIYSVMRQESGFRPSAASQANAFGLMQVIPATGARIASLKQRPYRDADLLDPQISIEFGAYYLKLLSLRLSHPALTVAAYNAGPRAIHRLERASSGWPFELLLLRIPFKETRVYVQRVLASMEIYSRLYPELGKLIVPLTVAAVPRVTDNGADEPLDLSDAF